MATPDETSGVERYDVEAVHLPDKPTPLYAKREKIHPRRVAGRFRTLKWLIMAVTLGVYYVTPWLRWDRGGHAPDQAVLVDFEHRRFFFFMIEIWPQEFYYVAGLLVMAGLGLFFTTSTVGRAWCGYTCPQTVWVDLFMAVERFFEGDRNARIRLDAAPVSLAKLRKRVLKHLVWLAISLLTGGVWIFYFADAPTLVLNVVAGTAPTVAYATIGVLTATTYIFGGFMREQVCIYMCPWPRIQTAMQDAHSLTVTYNDWRGEPRRPHIYKKREQQQQQKSAFGDCVDCNACVSVCPTGVDIRGGQQIGCITCGLCIDACDAVMDKIGRERGLISYATLADYNFNMLEAAGASDTAGVSGVPAPPAAPGAPDPQRVRDIAGDGRLRAGYATRGLRSILRPRTLIYLVIWSAIGVAMLTVLAMRGTIDVNVLHDRNPVYVQLSDGSMRNGYTVKILNKRSGARDFEISLDGLPGATLWRAGAAASPAESLRVDVGADRLRALKVFVRLDPDTVTSEHRFAFDFVVKAAGGNERATYQTWFETPADP